MAHGLTAGTPRRRRRLAGTALLLAVAAAHLAMLRWWHAEIAALRLHTALPAPIEVRFVHELRPAAPPTVAPPPAPRRVAPRGARPAAVAAVADPPDPAASQPAADAAPPAPPWVAPLPHELAGLGAWVDSLAEAPADTIAAIDPPSEPASTAAAPASATGDPAAAFAWPPSTRLRYRLSGWYRGEVHGSAQVQWLRDGHRYQVHLDVVVGPSFAPLLSRRMVSDGTLGDDGLRPRRYDELTRFAWRDPSSLSLHLGGETVQLAGGRAWPARSGMQDAASQFVQLTWLFTLRPERLRAGEVVEFPLVLPRRIARWRYEVAGEELLDTPLGGVPAMHVRPSADSRPEPGRELGAEAWFAPTLQYLPVRIRIRHDAQTWVDLVLAEWPQQSGASP